MQNTLSPNQKLRKAIDAWVSEDTENYRVAKQVLFAKINIGTKGLVRAEVVARLINMGNRELHLFQLGKYKNFDAAMVHKRRSQEYFRRAREMDK